MVPGVNGRARRRPSVAQVARRVGVQIVRDPFRLTLFLVTVMAVSRIHQQFPSLKPLRPALVLTGLAAVIAYFKPNLLSTRPLLETWPAKLVAAFAIWACLDAPFGIALGNSAQFIMDDYDKTVIFAFLIIVAMRGPRDFYGLVWTVVISTAFLVWTSLFIFKVTHYNGYDRLSNLDTYDANDLGLVLLVGLSFTLLAFQNAGKVGKLFCAVVLIGIGASIAKSGSRGALCGLVALAATLLVFLRGVPVLKRVAFIVVTGIAMTVFSPPGYWKQMSTLLNPKADYNWDSVNGRRQITLRGVGYWEQFPVFGLGIHNFSKAECSISEKARRHTAQTGIRCAPPHNAYVEAGSELGTFGIVLWLLMIPGGTLRLLQLRGKVPRAWATGDPEQRFLYHAPGYLAAGFAGFTVGSFFLSFAYTDVTYLMPAAWAALEIAVRPPTPPSKARYRYRESVYRLTPGALPPAPSAR
jgi:O-antigen ligase